MMNFVLKMMNVKATLGEISQISAEAARLDAIEALMNHTNPGPGGFYDELGAFLH